MHTIHAPLCPRCYDLLRRSPLLVEPEDRPDKAEHICAWCERAPTASLYRIMRGKQ